jgi:hypothetical protein
MLTLPSLNRRHKAGLLLVLAATGASLLLDASAKQTMGIVLLGLAVAWFVGSVAVRTLGIILFVMTFCIGLYVAVLPISNERESALNAAQEYDSALAAIREAVHKEKGDVWRDVGPPPGASPAEADTARKFAEDSNPKQPKKSSKAEREKYEVVSPVQIPEAARKWARPKPPDIIVTAWNENGDPVVSEFGFLDEMSEQDIIRKIQADDLLPRPAFSLKDSIASHRIACLGGGSLSLLGLSGCVFLIWQARKAKLKAAAAQT